MGRWMVVCAALALPLAAACSGGGSGDKTPTQPPGAVSTLAPLPSIDSHVALVAFQSKTLPYTISMPQGWQSEASRFGGDHFFVNRDDGQLLAEVYVSCATSIAGGKSDAESLLDDDKKLLKSAQSSAKDPVVTPIKAGDRDALRSTYEVTIGTTLIQHNVVYVSDSPCGWRIHMDVFGRGEIAEYYALFDRMVQTFQPKLPPAPQATP